MAVKSYRKRAQRPSVVYDPFREALSREIIAVEEQENYEKVAVQGTSNPVNIFIEIGEGPYKIKSLLARVDLRQLGWSERIQRQMGHTQEIWVKGRIPSPTLQERASWPIEGKSGCGGIEHPTLRRYPASYQGDMNTGPSLL